MIKELNHPLILNKLTIMRDEKTTHTDFRRNLNEIASLMVYEMLTDYKNKELKIKTPTGSVHSGTQMDKEIVVVPILRAGLGMVEGVLDMVPEARVGHIGLYRDEETLDIKEYFFKIPDVPKDSVILIADPMIATAASAICGIQKMKDAGFTDIRMMALIGAPEGIDKLTKAHPDVNLFIASIDEKLNDQSYIIPGLGDAGDRIFGTK